MKFCSPNAAWILCVFFGFAALASWMRQASFNAPMEPASSDLAVSVKPSILDGAVAAAANASASPSTEAESSERSHKEVLHLPSGPQTVLTPQVTAEKSGTISNSESSFSGKTSQRFYGRVVDQDGNPIRGAKIWTNSRNIQNTGGLKFVATDANGLFSLRIVPGKVMILEPSRNGYHFSRYTNQFVFDLSLSGELSRVSDPAKPVVFKMERRGFFKQVLISLGLNKKPSTMTFEDYAARGIMASVIYAVILAALARLARGSWWYSFFSVPVYVAAVVLPLVLVAGCLANVSGGDPSSAGALGGMAGVVLILVLLPVAIPLAVVLMVSPLGHRFSSIIGGVLFTSMLLGSAYFLIETSRETRGLQSMTPMSFYGCAVDEEGHPIHGAQVKIMWNNLLGDRQRILMTDANGFFSIQGLKGGSIGVEITHPDYHFSWRDHRAAFHYASPYAASFHIPDPQNPVVFTLHRKAPIQPLLRTEGDMDLNLESTSLLDVTSGKIVNDANIKPSVAVKWKRSKANGDKRFDWSFQLEGKNGLVLQEIREEFAAVAPSGGYQLSWAASMSKDDREWKGDLRPRFFFSVNGIKGRIDIRVIPYLHNDADFARFTILINPTGEPYLEYDPSRRLTWRSRDGGYWVFPNGTRWNHPSDGLKQYFLPIREAQP